MQRRLYNLGVFDKVDMAIQNPDGDEEDKYVDFHCVEGHLYALGIGLGAEIAKIGGSATSVSNPTGTTGFAPRFDLQLSRLNLWGLGHSLMFNGRYSTLDRRAALTYSIPRFRNVEGRNITVTGLYDNTRDVLTFTAVKYAGRGASLTTRGQGHQPAVPILVDGRSRGPDFTQDQSSSDSALFAAVASGRVRGEPGAGPPRRRRLTLITAFITVWILSYASHDFGGSVNFLRVLARNSYYKQLPKNLVLASNTEFGVIVPMQYRRRLRPRSIFRCRSGSSAAANPASEDLPRTRPGHATPKPAFRWAATRCSFIARNSASLSLAKTSRECFSMIWGTSIPAWARSHFVCTRRT